MLLACRGSVIVTGMGKAGIIGKKLAASLSSTGTPSFFLHPTEAVHGDVGSVRRADVVILLSYSGETEEILRLLPILRKSASATIAMTSHAKSRLACGVDLALLLGLQQEACALGLAPTCSTTSMLALGDALTLVVSEQRGFTREQFASFHPAGSLGKKLSSVEETMRPLAECRLANQSHSIRQVLIHVGRPGRRTGAIMLVNNEGSLVGIFTDSDLARMLENAPESQLDRPISEVMTRSFQTITKGRYLSDAMRLLAQRKISELPVVSEDGRPLGIIDVTDVMSLMSDAWSESEDNRSQEPRILSLVEHRANRTP
jgi:arabinose-5-phosphate isomerase